MQTKKKNKKGQGRKPDPSKAVNHRFKIADYQILMQIYGCEKGDVTRGLKALALKEIEKYKKYENYLESL